MPSQTKILQSRVGLSARQTILRESRVRPPKISQPVIDFTQPIGEEELVEEELIIEPVKTAPQQQSTDPALELLARKLAGRGIINPGGDVGKEYAKLLDQYYASGQDINSISGLKNRVAQLNAEENPFFSAMPRTARDIANYESFYKGTLIKSGISEQEAQKIVEKNRPFTKQEDIRAVRDYTRTKVITQTKAPTGDVAIASAAGGGVIRVRRDGTAYIDRSTTLEQAAREVSGKVASPTITKTAPPPKTAINTIIRKQDLPAHLSFLSSEEDFGGLGGTSDFSPVTRDFSRDLVQDEGFSGVPTGNFVDSNFAKTTDGGFFNQFLSGVQRGIGNVFDIGKSGVEGGISFVKDVGKESGVTGFVTREADIFFGDREKPTRGTETFIDIPRSQSVSEAVGTIKLNFKNKDFYNALKSAPTILFNAITRKEDRSAVKEQELQNHLKDVRALPDSVVNRIATQARDPVYIQVKQERDFELQVNEPFQKRAKEEAQALSAEYQNKLDQAGVGIQNDINSGKITLAEGNKRLDKIADKINTDYQKEFEEVIIPRLQDEFQPRIDSIQRDAEKGFLIAGLGSTAIQSLIMGYTLGAGIAFTPLKVQRAAALGFGGAFAYGTSKLGFDVVTGEAGLKDVALFGAGTAGFIGGGIAGGRAGAKIRNKYIDQPRIERALAETYVTSNVKAENLDVLKLRSLTLDGNVKLELQDFVNRGYSVRLVETKLKATTTKAQEILPDVRGNFIQVLTRDGQILKEYSLGQVIATHKGKVFSQDVIAQAVGLVKGGRTTTFAEVLSGKFNKKGFVPIERANVLTESMLREKIKTPKGEEIKFDVDVSDILGTRMKFPEKTKPIPTETFSKGIDKLFDTKVQAKEMENYLKEQRKFAEKSLTGEFVALRKTKGVKLSKETTQLGDNFADIIIGKKLTKEIGRGVLERIGARSEFLREARKGKRKTSLDKTFSEEMKAQEKAQAKDFNEQRKQLQEGLKKLTQVEKPFTTTLQEKITLETGKELALKTRKAPRVRTLFGTDVRFGNLGKVWQGQRTITKTKEMEKLKSFSNLNDLTRTIDLQKSFERAGLKSLQLQKQLQNQKLETGFGVLTDLSFKLETPALKLLLPPFKKTKEDKAAIEREMRMPHDVFIKEGGRYVKVTKKPLINYQRGLDYGSYFTDNLLSAQFKVRPSGKKPGREEMKVPKDYWRQSSQKFRPYRIQRGQKIPLVKQFIEFPSYRLDSYGEISKLNFARLKAQERQRQKELTAYNQRINNMFGFTQPQNSRKGNNKKAYGFSNIDKLTGYDPNLKLI